MSATLCEDPTHCSGSMRLTRPGRPGVCIFRSMSLLTVWGSTRSLYPSRRGDEGHFFEKPRRSLSSVGVEGAVRILLAAGLYPVG